jgi:hypothetical protein
MKNAYSGSKPVVTGDRYFFRYPITRIRPAIRIHYKKKQTIRRLSAFPP